MTKRSGITILLTGILLIAGLFTPSCNSIDEGYIVRLDSLDQMHLETEQFLTLDMVTIEARKQLIFDHLRLMRQYYDGQDQTMGRNLTKYKGILKSYTRYLGKHAAAQEEHIALKKQAEDLRTSVLNKEISKAEFKSYYSTEFKDSEINHGEAKVIFEALHSIEPEYQRISRHVSEELHRIAQSDTALAQILSNIQSDTTALSSH